MTDIMKKSSLKKAARAFGFDTPPKKHDYHKDALVTAVNPDGSYQIAFDDAPDTPVKCTAGCDASVGNRVFVCVQSSGRCVAICRLGL